MKKAASILTLTLSLSVFSSAAETKMDSAVVKVLKTKKR